MSKENNKTIPKNIIINKVVEFPEDFIPPEDFSGIWEDELCINCPYYKKDIYEPHDWCELTGYEECDCPLYPNWDKDTIEVNIN